MAKMRECFPAAVLKAELLFTQNSMIHGHKYSAESKYRTQRSAIKFKQISLLNIHQ